MQTWFLVGTYLPTSAFGFLTCVHLCGLWRCARGSQLVWVLGELVGVNAKGVEDLLTDFVRHLECT